MRPRVFLLVLALAATVLATVGSPPGNHPLQTYVPGEVLLKFRPDAPPLARAKLLGEFGATTLHTFASQAEHWRIAPGVSVEDAVARLSSSPVVEYAEPNYLMRLDVIPNDPRLGELWGMVNTGQTGGTADADIDADLAWGVSTGSPNVVVGVIDTGVDYTHPELVNNIWSNTDEIDGNGIDDDGNGYIDDIRGWDFVNHDNNPMDDHSHGTHVSGTITAQGNNSIGVAGVAWNVKIMPLKFLNSGGSGSTTDAVLAVDYATANGANLTSNSWGGGAYSQTLYDAIARANANNIAFVAAAGNDGVNNDSSPHYPSSYDLPNIIAVAATDDDDLKASFSCWGPTSVDLAAPGVNILSTTPGNSYGTMSGTSMATPHVSGICALIRSVSPNIPVAQMKQVLMNSVDHIASMQGLVVSNGRANAFFAIAEPDDVPPGSVDDLAATEPGSNTMGLTWTATGDDGETGTATYYDMRYSMDPIDDTNFDAATRAGNEPVPAEAGTVQSMEVRGLEASAHYYFALRAFDEWGNAGLISNVADERTLPPPTAQAVPTSITDDLFTGEVADHVVTLSNIGEGTLDWTVPTPTVGEPLSAPPEPLELGKDDVDPRSGSPVIENSGGPDAFGYRWTDSDELAGPAFAWIEISETGTPIGLTSDDSTSAPLDLGFNFPFYGTLFSTIRACTNGWISFTSSATSYGNQPLPNSGAPDNVIAALWDDLNPGGTNRMFFQSFGNKAVVQWNAMPPYSGGGAQTFEIILDQSGAITLQYLTLTGSTTSATVGIQNADKTIGLQVAFNQDYLHNDLAIRIAATPQWLTAGPNSGRLHAGESIPLNVHMDASGLDGGIYPGQVNIYTNDPVQPVITVDVTMNVTGAPDITVQPPALDFGDAFVELPETLTLIVANDGTDTLHVSNIATSHPEITTDLSTFEVPAHGSQNVIVTWTPSVLGPFVGSLTIFSDARGEPELNVPVSGNSIPAPVMVVDPTFFDETLYSGHQVVRQLNVTNSGGSDLVVTAFADQGGGVLIGAKEEGALGSGGPDDFGYRWRDSDESGGPAYDFADISATGTQITFSSQDDAVSAAIPMGMNFPFYGNTFSSLKVATNGWLTFDTAETSSRLSNYNLPNTSGAKNMIAMFWDDLHLRSGNVKYLYDGARFIVQYTNVEKYSPSGYPLTFQVQLYPSGKILLQYQTMAGTLNSATIGIQNEAKTIGLTANYNANYVHSEMAINFSRVPDWLSVTPGGATIPPGETAVFDVTFNSEQRNGGDLVGAVVLNTNIPAQPQERVPATLHVIGAPIVGVVPESYDFGQQYIGYSYVSTFQVVNNGTDVLNVSNVTSDDPNLFVEEPVGYGETPMAAFPLPPGQARLFNLRWAPVVPYTMNAQVHVLSDDPVNPDLVMPVTGVAIPPPVAVYNPDHFTESMNSGEVVHRTLHVENQGGSDLIFDTRIGLNSGASVTMYPELELKKDEEDPRQGVLGIGGPDVYGYTWKDSDQVDGPVFDWTDIRDTGTVIAGLDSDDESSSPINLGFAFPFYGTNFTSLTVKTNGWLSFTNTTTDLSNDPLPNTGAPENLLAVFWDDLHFRSVERARYFTDGNKFVVQYTEVDKYSPSGASLTFQVILYANGRIRYQYLTMNGTLNSATVGIQNAAKTDGLTVVYNADYIHDQLAVEFSPPFIYPQVTPPSGVIPPGGFMDLDVEIDSGGMLGGDYHSTIDMTTNDPTQGLIVIPVDVHVVGIPDVEVQPTSLLFPTTFVGFSSSQVLTITNVGTDSIFVNALNVTGEFQASGVDLPTELRPGKSANVTVSFWPLDEGTRLGSIGVVTNDPDEPEIIVPLQGEGLWPPEIHVTPPSISTALPPGGNRHKTLNIANAGGSDLVWNAGTNLISGTVTPGSYMELGKDEEDPREGILGSGGPDLFGYKWVDSDDPGGPVFDWFDITNIGTPITQLTGDDQNVSGVPIGFAFPFYGNSFTTLNFSTNGWMSFTSTLTAYSNNALPNSGSSVPENMLAPFWDDMHFRSAVHAYFWSDNTRFIAQYNNVDRYATGSNLTFQVILYPNGKIVFQYLTMTGTLNSATIGIQNAAKDDGLTVVYNADYVHDNMAIEFKTIPEWAKLNPTEGVIPESLNADVDLLIDAMGLEDGIHEAVLLFHSNDPYNPLVQVPVTLNVGAIEPTLTEFIPKVLRLGDTSILRVRMKVELPAGLDPHAIRLSSVLFNDTVPALENPAPYFEDANHNGIEEAVFWFDWDLASATLQEGTLIPVTIQGEVEDVQWWRGTGYIRTGDPEQYAPVPGAYYVAGGTVPVQWQPASDSIPHLYSVQLSRDGGTTWETLATNLTTTSFDWVATGESTAAIMRVLSYDQAGTLLGSDDTNGTFTIAGTLLPPNPILGAELLVVFDGSTVRVDWKAPLSDATHGPADRYRVLRGSNPANLQEVSLVNGTTYSEAGDATQGVVTYYRIVAANAAGDATAE
ncbi:MAG: S8 family serine peptidase [Acidobacteria bacterium]|nr:S8 family serine peptidase [Acidobacteriota bacterium]